MCVWCVWTSALRGWGQSVWWVAFGFVRRAPRLQRLAIGVTVRWRDPRDGLSFLRCRNDPRPTPALSGGIYMNQGRATPRAMLWCCQRRLSGVAEDHGNHHALDLPFSNWFWKTHFFNPWAQRLYWPLPARNCAMRAARRRGNRGTRRIYGQRPSSNGAQSSSTPGLASNKYVSKHCCRVTTAEPNPSLMIMAHAR